MAKDIVQEGTDMIRCDLKELLPAVGLLNALIPTKTPKPILENILFEVQEGKLHLFATDLEVGLKISLEKVEAKEGLRFLVPGAKLAALLREIEEETVEFQKEDGFVRLLTSQDEFRLLSLSAADFPEFASLPEEETFEIPGEELKRMLQRTSFAAASEASRYTMNALLFDIKENTLHIVSTDGKRLALAKRPVAVEESHFLLLPIKGVKLLERMLFEESVKLFFEEGMLLVQIGSQVLYLRLLQGNYPPYENVIPSEYPIQVKIQSTAFLKGLRKSSLLTTQDSKSVRLHFEGDQLTLYSNDPNVGEAKVVVPLEEPVSESFEISFNPTLLMDALKVMGEKELHLEFRDSKSPCIFREEQYVYVVMPLNL